MGCTSTIKATRPSLSQKYQSLSRWTRRDAKGLVDELLLGRYISGYLEKGIQTPMAPGRSAKIISMIKWIRTSRLSIKKTLSLSRWAGRDTKGLVDELSLGEVSARYPKP